MTFLGLVKNFFTHKDFLPPRSEIPGMLFSPLHFVVSAIVLAVFVYVSYRLIKGNEKTMKVTLTVLWGVTVFLEIVKLFWEIFAGREVYVFVQGVLPLYPCSIFLFAFPLAVWGKGLVKHAVSAYVCILGLMGAAVNFFYPANVMGEYPCISFAGLLTLFTHGVMLTSALVLLFRRELRFDNVDSIEKLLAPCVPVLIFSIPVNIVNFTCDADYMFFKCDSFFLKPIGDATPDYVTVIIMYVLYIAIHVLPFLPSYISNLKKQREKAE